MRIFGIADVDLILVKVGWNLGQKLGIYYLFYKDTICSTKTCLKTLDIRTIGLIPCTYKD